MGIIRYCIVHLKDRILHDLLGHKIFQFLGIILQDLDSLNKLRSHRELLRLFNCKIISKSHKNIPSGGQNMLSIN